MKKIPRPLGEQPSEIELAAEVFRGERSLVTVEAIYGTDVMTAVARQVERLHQLQAASDRIAERLEHFVRTGRYPPAPIDLASPPDRP